MPSIEPPENCRLCAGVLEPVYDGSGGGVNTAGFEPTFHGPGHHGGLLRCRECGAVQQPSLPRGERLLDLYRDMHDADYMRQEPGRRRTAERLLDLVAPHVPAGRLLDVGCGHGLLMDEARRRGYDVEGLELSRVAAAYARNTLGLRVSEVPLDQADFRDAVFDVIVLADVLEHLDDPLAALDRATGLLASGGVLLVVTPDPASLTARIAGARWWGYLPAHTCLIPRVTLRELIAIRGLVLAEDIALRRSFSAGYWLRGLAERRGRQGAGTGSLASLLEKGPRVTLSLGDERVLVARKLEVLKPARPRVVDRSGPTKVHVVLPAYKAEQTVGEVAEQLPTAAADRALLVDDASPDGTVGAALAAGFEVLIHPTNRGYGANQKTCYVRAALDGADIVVMVHADNQYDPSLVPEMVAPIAAGKADVVIGSRLLEDEAISGGMPRWKWVGNRALTWVENRAFRRRYSEYHTGYRAFSVPFLRTIPFLRNGDDFAFDQSICAQMVAANARVVELAIPTRYFLEASSVSFRASVGYGLRTLMILARFRLDERRRRWLVLRRPTAALGVAPDKLPAAGGPSAQ